MGVAANMINTIEQIPNIEIIVFDLRNRQNKGTRKGAKSRTIKAVKKPIRISGFVSHSRPCMGTKTT